ncbi:MAG: hypothetical protein LBQ70_00635 [Prevotellaceae bacterium]|jgi:hypothetical protein|nr:hypothetical protein [Prevotellaceae bacterium]
MHIANPTCDVVFKYMMEDEKVAKSFLSAIIGAEVLELDFASQEHTVRIFSEEKIEMKAKKKLLKNRGKHLRKKTKLWKN